MIEQGPRRRQPLDRPGDQRQSEETPTCWFFKGTLLRAQGKPDEALAAFGQAIALKPDHVSALIERANLRNRAQANSTPPRPTSTRAQESRAERLLVLYTQALLDFTQGKYAAAKESLQKVLRVGARAHADHLAGRRGRAEPRLLAASRAALEASTWRSTRTMLYARKLLAQTQLKSAQPADAAATLAPLLKDGAPGCAIAGAGRRVVDAGDATSARPREYFEKASALAPKAAALHTSLGLSKLGQGDKDTGDQRTRTGHRARPEIANRPASRWSGPSLA